MMDLVQIMDSDTKKTAKVAKLKEWFVAREAQMAQLSLDGKLFLHQRAKGMFEKLLGQADLVGINHYNKDFEIDHSLIDTISTAFKKCYFVTKIVLTYRD